MLFANVGFEIVDEAASISRPLLLLHLFIIITGFPGHMWRFLASFLPRLLRYFRTVLVDNAWGSLIARLLLKSLKIFRGRFRSL